MEDDDFDDDEDFEDIEEEDEEKPKTKKKPGKKSKKVDVDEEEEDEDEDEDEDEEEIEEIEKVTSPQPKMRKEEVKETVDRYSPFHIAERTGIKDNSTEMPIAEDVYSILSIILNKIQKIEESVS